MESATAVYGVQALAALLRLLPERDPHPHLFEALDVILDNLTSTLPVRLRRFSRYWTRVEPA